MKWRTGSTLPLNKGPDWGIWHGGTLKASGLGACRAMARTWEPIGGVLVGKPGVEHLLPPVALPEMVDVFQAMLVRRLWKMMLVYLVASLVFAALTVTKSFSAFAPLAGVAILMLLVTASDAHVFRSSAALVERAQFAAHLRHDSEVRVGVLAYIAIMFVALACQAAFAQGWADVESPVRAYGVYYVDIARGEWWRLISGPYIHSNLVHWASNVVVGVVGVAVSVAAAGKRTCCVAFAVGNIIAAWGQWMLAGTSTDSMTGVSGGVFAMYGLAIGAGVGRRGQLPRGAWIPLSATLALSVPLSIMSDSKVAVHAHWSGLVFGVLLAGLLRNR